MGVIEDLTDEIVFSIMVGVSVLVVGVVAHTVAPMIVPSWKWLLGLAIFAFMISLGLIKLARSFSSNTY